MNKIIENIKRGNYKVVDNQGISVTQHFTQCLEKEFADLEAKLAESEKKHLLDEREWQDYCAYKHIEPQIKGCLDREREYEKQLAEKETRIAELEDKDWYEALIEQLEEQNGRLIEERYNVNLQLAEKEKEIERLREINLDVPIKQMQFHHNQDKISFTVEKLVGVQKYISDNAVFVEEECFGREINDYIDNQIEQLKKEMK